MHEEGPGARPLPRISPDNRPFWEACRNHRLELPWCGDCGSPHLPPGPVCPFCLSDAITWRTATGRGRIASWVRVHKAWFPAFAGQVPYTVVLVELAEGPRLIASMADRRNAAVDIGMEVAVAFEDLDQTSLPVFTPWPSG